jgi:hypothetical protein
LFIIAAFSLLSIVSPPYLLSGATPIIRIKIHQNVLGILKNTDISRKNAKDNSEKPNENHINNIISEGFENNNSKPFWNYMKSKKQDNIRVVPLKRSGGLYESKEKAEILNNQFKSVFTKPKPNTCISTTVLPQRAGSTIQNTCISTTVLP